MTRDFILGVCMAYLLSLPKRLFAGRLITCCIHSPVAIQFTKTDLFRSFCLSLYGSALWSSSSKELKSLEVCFNNVIRKIWHLPQRCHTSVLHLVSGLPSIFNTIITRSYRLTAAALQSSSPLIADIYGDATKLVYTSSGFNLFHGHNFWKSYNVSDIALSKFILDVKLSPHLNSHLLNDINLICTYYFVRY